MFRRERRENVNVIRRAVNDERFAVMRADDAPRDMGTNAILIPHRAMADGLSC
jgi:hypothetical protein